MFPVIFLVLCFLAGIAASWLWLKLALSRQWFDIPNQRSSHARPTPKGGGLGFALVFSCVGLFLAWQGFYAVEYALVLVPALALAATGIWDDLRELGILPRMRLQVLAVTAALWIIPGVPFVDLPVVGSIPPALTLLLLVIGWVWLVNLYNFMDGIDGLAATQAVFVALALGWFALGSGLHGSSLLLLSLAVILGSFLCFNWSPARLFMGDAGSNFLGFVLVAYGLLLVQDGAITIWTLIILLAVFIADASLTLFKRMGAGLVWYHGHRSHAYQLLAQARQSHAYVVTWVAVINLLWLLPLAWLSADHRQWGAAPTLLAFMPLLALVHVCHARYLHGSMQ